MKASDKVKIGLGAVGVGIIGYGMYSMKKDTEEFLKAPGSFLDGLFAPTRILGGSGLPDSLANLPENLRNIGNKAKSSFLDGLTDGLSTSLGLGKPPSSVNTNLAKTGIKEYKAPDTIFETSKKPVTMPTIRKTLDVNIPMAGAMPGASPVTKYTEKTSSSSSSNSYTDSTGRVYTPANVIIAKAKW